MNTLHIPLPPKTSDLRRGITAWRIRRDHRARPARITEIFCLACRHWRTRRHFARNTTTCRACDTSG